MSRVLEQTGLPLYSSDLYERGYGDAGKDFLNPFRSADNILTNPPYVTSAAMRRLPAEYRHEPGLALAAGKQGLDVVTRILAEAPAYLAQRGTLVCEVGAGRKSVEKAWRGAELIWPKDEVFIAGREGLASAARTGASPRTRSTPARARR